MYPLYQLHYIEIRKYFYYARNPIIAQCGYIGDGVGVLYNIIGILLNVLFPLENINKITFLNLTLKLYTEGKIEQYKNSFL